MVESSQTELSNEFGWPCAEEKANSIRGAIDDGAKHSPSGGRPSLPRAFADTRSSTASNVSSPCRIVSHYKAEMLPKRRGRFPSRRAFGALLRVTVRKSEAPPPRFAWSASPAFAGADDQGIPNPSRTAAMNRVNAAASPARAGPIPHTGFGHSGSSFRRATTWM
jgi:hypothetical protein